MMIERKLLTPWLIGAAVLGLVAKSPYRLFINYSGVNDLGLSGVLPSFAWAAFLSFVFALWWSPWVACRTALFAGVLHELNQLRHDGFEDTFLSSVGLTFDVWDIVATVAGSTAAFLGMRRLVRVTGRDGNRDLIATMSPPDNQA